MMGKNGGGSYTFGIDRLCAWDVNDLQYTEPSTRNPFVEKPGVDFSLSPQDLEDLRESRRVNELAGKRTQLRQRVADSIKNKTYTYAPYVIAFSTKTNHENHLKTQSHREKASGTTKTPSTKISAHLLGQATNISQKRFCCTVCDYAAGTPQLLNNHLDTMLHHERELFLGTSNRGILFSLFSLFSYFSYFSFLELSLTLLAPLLIIPII
jgi:hypothetical protein